MEAPTIETSLVRMRHFSLDDALTLFDFFSRWGFATEVSRTAVEFAFNKGGITRLVGVTDPRNAACIAVLKKCGMTYWKSVLRRGSTREVYLMEASENRGEE